MIFVRHSAKGSEWEEHKYVKKLMGITITQMGMVKAEK